MLLYEKIMKGNLNCPFLYRSDIGQITKPNTDENTLVKCICYLLHHIPNVFLEQKDITQVSGILTALLRCAMPMVNETTHSTN